MIIVVSKFGFDAVAPFNRCRETFVGVREVFSTLRAVDVRARLPVQPTFRRVPANSSYSSFAVCVGGLVLHIFRPRHIPQIHEPVVVADAILMVDLTLWPSTGVDRPGDAMG